MSWQLLPDELKKDIIELLDYGSRCHLRTCSKSDKDTVDSTKLIVKKLKIMETYSQMTEGKTIIRLDIDTFTIWFIGKENLTRIDRGWNGEIIAGFSDIKQKNRYELIAEFFMRFNITRADDLEVRNILFPVPPSWNIKCDYLELSNIAEEYYVEWLRKCLNLNPKLKKLEFRGPGNDPEVTGLISEISVTDNLRIDYESEFTNEQLINFEAQNLRVRSSNFTVAGSKQRLEKFLKLGQKDDELWIHFPKPENFSPLDQLLPKSLILRKKIIKEDGDVYVKIVGGFENVHGVQNPRVFESKIFRDWVFIICTKYEEWYRNYELYPFD